MNVATVLAQLERQSGDPNEVWALARAIGGALGRLDAPSAPCASETWETISSSLKARANAGRAVDEAVAASYLLLSEAISSYRAIADTEDGALRLLDRLTKTNSHQNAVAQVGRDVGGALGRLDASGARQAAAGLDRCRKASVRSSATGVVLALIGLHHTELRASSWRLAEQLTDDWSVSDRLLLSVVAEAASAPSAWARIQGWDDCESGPQQDEALEHFEKLAAVGYAEPIGQRWTPSNRGRGYISDKVHRWRREMEVEHSALSVRR